ncbi:MAG: alpha/beta hydrolase family esterase [Planctomycetaceae bacterium]
MSAGLRYVALLVSAWAAIARAEDSTLGPGDHLRQLVVEGRSRSYIVHIPRNHDSKRPAPVVLAFHGALMNAQWMSVTCGLSRKADAEDFLVAYPNGTGPGEKLLVFNAGLFRGPLGEAVADDVLFTRTLLDDLEQTVAVDNRRIYATGLSNGGMMCYRLAAELSDRIAAIAPVAGTLALDQYAPQRPVPVLHFHGTDDRIVPFDGPTKETPEFLRFHPVAETMRWCAQANGCQATPRIEELPDRYDDGTTVECQTYEPQPGGAETVLYVIHQGGHTWPGRTRPLLTGVIGRTTREISANDLMWEFFKKNPRP